MLGVATVFGGQGLAHGRVPHGLLFAEGIAEHEELAHAGGEGHELGLAGRDEALVEGAEARVGPAGGKRGHIERGADRRAPTPDGAAPAPGAAVAIERGDADEGGDLRLVELPSGGQLQGVAGDLLGDSQAGTATLARRGRPSLSQARWASMLRLRACRERTSAVQVAGLAGAGGWTSAAKRASTQALAKIARTCRGLTTTAGSPAAISAASTACSVATGFQDEPGGMQLPGRGAPARHALRGCWGSATWGSAHPDAGDVQAGDWGISVPSDAALAHDSPWRPWQRYGLWTSATRCLRPRGGLSPRCSDDPGLIQGAGLRPAHSVTQTILEAGSPPTYRTPSSAGKTE